MGYFEWCKPALIHKIVTLAFDLPFSLDVIIWFNRKQNWLRTSTSKFCIFYFSHISSPIKRAVIKTNRYPDIISWLDPKQIRDIVSTSQFFFFCLVQATCPIQGTQGPIIRPKAIHPITHSHIWTAHFFISIAAPEK